MWNLNTMRPTNMWTFPWDSAKYQERQEWKTLPSLAKEARGKWTFFMWSDNVSKLHTDERFHASFGSKQNIFFDSVGVWWKFLNHRFFWPGWWLAISSTDMYQKPLPSPPPFLRNKNTITCCPLHAYLAQQQHQLFQFSSFTYIFFHSTAEFGANGDQSLKQLETQLK